MTVVQRLIKIAHPHRGNVYASAILLAISSILDSAFITFLFTSMIFVVLGAEEAQKRGFGLQIFHTDFGKLLQDLLRTPDPVRMLMMLAGCTVLAIFIKCLSDARLGYLMNRFSNLVAKDIRQQLFVHFLRMSPAFFEREATGVYSSRITNDVGVLQSCLGPQLAELIQAPLTITVSLLLMVGVSWQLTLVTLCLAPIVVGAISITGRLLRKLTMQIQEKLGDFNAGLIERLSNVRVIQSFVREPFEDARVGRLNELFYRKTMRAVLIAETIAPGIELIAVIGMVCGIVVAGMCVLPHSSAFLLPTVSHGSFLFFLLQAQKGGSQFRRLSRVNQMRQQALGASERIFDLLDEEPEIQNAPHAQVLPTVRGRVTLDHLSFSYGNGEEVLRGIDLDVAPGEIIALVGPSGAGKTTLVNLISRFYDPAAGRILLDGHDLRDVTLDSLREQIGLVPQETILFSDSIYENIRYGKLQATEEEVIAAAHAANAMEFIERLPEGFQTPVGERGARLSGGQRQRVAIARAILKNPRILLLDEATSALDTESEHLVQQALERLMLDRTTFVIAHRLSTVKHATRILVLNRGAVAELGTHESLLARDGLYRRLYEMQFRATPGPEAVG